MTEMAHRVLVATGALLAFAVGWRLLVTPSTRAEESLRAEISRLGEAPSNVARAVHLEKIGRDLLAVRARALDEPHLPQEPSLERLIAISQRADAAGEAGRTVRAGRPGAPAFGGPAQCVALPVEVHLETTLAPTLSLIEAIEACTPAVRVESIEIVAARTAGRNAHEPMLVSTIEVEAIYEPSQSSPSDARAGDHAK